MATESVTPTLVVFFYRVRPCWLKLFFLQHSAHHRVTSEHTHQPTRIARRATAEQGQRPTEHRARNHYAEQAARTNGRREKGAYAATGNNTSKMPPDGRAARKTKPCGQTRGRSGSWIRQGENC